MVKGGAYAGTGFVGGVADADEEVVTAGAADVDDDDDIDAATRAGEHRRD